MSVIVERIVLDTNEDLALWAAEKALTSQGKHTANKLLAISKALRGLDANTDAHNGVYHIAFDPNTVEGKVIVTKVRIGHEVLSAEEFSKRNHLNKFNPMLCNHPLYPLLTGYVQANPEKVYYVPEEIK